MTEAQTFEQQFEAVLRRHLRLPAPDTAIDEDADLAASGLDSLGTVTLLVDLEQTFAVSFPGSMLTQATFRSAASLRTAVHGLVSP